MDPDVRPAPGLAASDRDFNGHDSFTEPGQSPQAGRTTMADDTSWPARQQSGHLCRTLSSCGVPDQVDATMQAMQAPCTTPPPDGSPIEAGSVQLPGSYDAALPAGQLRDRVVVHRVHNPRFEGVQSANRQLVSPGDTNFRLVFQGLANPTFVPPPPPATTMLDVVDHFFGKPSGAP
jgi:hypothetical protein